MRNNRSKKILIVMLMLLSLGALLASTNVAYAKKKKDDEKISRFEQKYGMKKTTAQVKERRAARREGRPPAKVKSQADWFKVGQAAEEGTSVSAIEARNKSTSGDSGNYEGTGWYGPATSPCKVYLKNGKPFSDNCDIKLADFSEHQLTLLENNQEIYYEGYGNTYGKSCNATKVTACGNNCECDDCGWRQCYPPEAQTGGGRGGSGGGGVVGPGCSSTQPAKPFIVYPEDGAKISEDQVTLQWTQGSMGTSCAGNVNGCFLSIIERDIDTNVLAARSQSPFSVIEYLGKKIDRYTSLFDGSVRSVIPFEFSGTGSASNLSGYTQVPCSPGEYTLDVDPGKEYTWEVIASNGTLTNSSGEVSFIVSTLADLTGYIWDSSSVSCSASPSATEIQPSDIDGNVAVAVGAINGTWDPNSFDGYSYEVNEVPFGTGQIICASVPDPVDKPNFRYVLECLDDSTTGIISGACASVDVDGSTSTIDLGFRLASTGWFQSIGGDIFGGCTVDNCAASISVGIPEVADILGGFADNLIADIGTVFSNSDISVEGDRYSEDGNRNLLNISTDSFFPDSFSFSAPVDAEEVSNCDGMFGGDLDGGIAYTASRSCVQDGLDNLSGSYGLGSDGVAVVFVEGDGSSIVFDKNFTSSSSNQRVMFIAQDSIEITPDIGELAPTNSTPANIQASIISEQSIYFQSIGAGSEDTTAVVEGPLVTKDGAVVFGRDRILNNGYPAEVVVYNPIYLTALSDSPISGVSAIDISWSLQQ